MDYKHKGTPFILLLHRGIDLIKLSKFGLFWCIIPLSKNFDRQSGNGYSVDGSPNIPNTHWRGGGAYGQKIFNYTDNYNRIFNDFSYKSKLVAHTVKCSD